MKGKMTSSPSKVAIQLTSTKNKDDLLMADRQTE